MRSTRANAIFLELGAAPTPVAARAIPPGGPSVAQSARRSDPKTASVKCLIQTFKVPMTRTGSQPVQETSRTPVNKDEIGRCVRDAQAVVHVLNSSQ